MTWTPSTDRATRTNRGEVLRSAVDVVNARRDGLLPMDLDGVAQTFGDELSLLGALLLKWHTRLAGQVECALLDQPMDLESAVVAAWCAASEQLPGVRMVIDHYREHPVDAAMAAALHRATVKEHMTLATLAGRSSVDDPSGAPLGVAIEDRARELYEAMPHLPAPTASRSLLGRLRAALVA